MAYGEPSREGHMRHQSIKVDLRSLRITSASMSMELYKVIDLYGKDVVVPKELAEKMNHDSYEYRVVGYGSSIREYAFYISEHKLHIGSSYDPAVHMSVGGNIYPALLQRAEEVKQKKETTINEILLLL